MDLALKRFIEHEVSDWKEEGTFRVKRTLQSAQGGRVELDGRKVVMLSSNNYLGLASHPATIEAAKQALDQFGCGAASVSEVCGLFDLHLSLSRAIADLHGADAAILYSSCSTANIGVIDCLMGEGDLIFSDEFNHASIIDGCRISKAQTVVYPHADMKALQENLEAHAGARRKLIVTDGVFSMEGDAAPLDAIVALAKRYAAISMVDESHAVGVLGMHGGGTVEHYAVQGRIDIVTGTFGKALGGAGGGYVCGAQTLMDYLYHRSRAFIFTNALPPATVAVGLAALKVLADDPSLLRTLRENTQYFREQIGKIGLHVLGGESPIVPVLIGDTVKAYAFSNYLMEDGVFLTAVGYPVVPRDQARLRAQLSAALTREDINLALDAIARAAKKLNVLED